RTAALSPAPLHGALPISLPALPSAGRRLQAATSGKARALRALRIEARLREAPRMRVAVLTPAVYFLLPDNGSTAMSLSRRDRLTDRKSRRLNSSHLVISY